MTQLDLTSWEPNTPHLERVSSRISRAILEFLGARGIGSTFHADELRAFVAQKTGPVAPGSADRILRQLRQKGLASYSVLNRRESSYLVGAL